MRIAARNNVRISGHGRAIMFAHGFGCDQNMWRYVAPAFEDRFRVILFDYVGAGQSDLGAYSFDKYSTLDGYADDVVEVGRETGLTNAVFIGHSVSAMIGIIAARKAPNMFGALVLVSPSPCHLNEGDYVGGFTKAQIDELLGSMDHNHLGWSATMAPVIMGNPDRPDLGEQLTNSFCRTDPEIAKQFARVTFLTDSRPLLPQVHVPTLVLQCSEDIIAPDVVGEYVHRNIPGSELVKMAATGHCPNLSAPQETIAAIEAFLR